MRRVSALLLCTMTWACGYSLVGSGRGTLPEGVKSVYVDAFVNDTAKVGLEQRLTEAVLRELSARSRLKPTNDRAAADAILSGKLVSYQVDPVRFDNAGRALEYQISVTAKITLVERSTEKSLFEDPAFQFRQPYVVPGATTGGSGYFDVETAAVETLARPFARSLVTAILEGF